MKELLLIPIFAVILMSGCIAEEHVASGNEVICELGGGIWLEDYNECCPKGCPAEEITFPTTATDQAIVDRCSVCWLP